MSAPGRVLGLSLLLLPILSSPGLLGAQTPGLQFLGHRNTSLHAPGRYDSHTHSIPATETKLSTPAQSSPLLGHTAQLGRYLQGVVDQELATPMLQTFLDQLPYSTLVRNDSNTVLTIAQAVQTKVDTLVSLVTELKRVAEQEPSFPSAPLCCSLPPAQFRPSPSAGLPVATAWTCEASSLPPASLQPLAPSLTALLQRQLPSPGLLWQFLLHPSGREVLHPAPLSPSCGPAPHSALLLPTLHPGPKAAVLVLDTSLGLSHTQFLLGQAALTHLLSSLGPGDRVAVLLLTSRPVLLEPRPAASCLTNRLLPLRPSLQLELLDQVESLQQSEARPAHLHTALVAALGLLSTTSPAQVVMVSSPSQLLRAQPSLLATIGSQQGVTLSAVALQDLGDSTDLSLLSLPHRPLSSVASLPASLASWYLASPPSPSPLPLFSPPSWDATASRLTISLTLPLTLASLQGVAGLTADLQHLGQELLYQPRERGQRLFLMDSSGRALLHPALPATGAHRGEDVRRLELAEGFDSALHRILSEPSGQVRVGGTSYTWRGLRGCRYIVVMAAEGGEDGVTEVRRLSAVPYSREGADFQYHSLVLAGTTKLCRHLGQVASMQAASLYLAPVAFSAPYDQLREDTVPLRTQSLMAFLTDPTRLIANPGLAAGVRPDTMVVARLASHWRDRAEASPLNNYIVRRRVATPRGVLLEYPGTRQHQPGEPALQPWYHHALQLTGSLVVAAPALDPGGAGYIVTVSQAVSQGNSSLGERQEAAVVSVDFTLGYFYKIMNDSVPGGGCSSPGTRCFLIERSGYLVAHSALQGEGRGRSAEARHITHVEPLLATELLGRRGVMVKQQCWRPEDDSLQRHFLLQLGEGEVVRSEGQGCREWELSPVAGTNLVLGVVREASPPCSQTPAFCWCSTVDRTCLDCHRMEQAECECPCECRQGQQYCGAGDSSPSPTPCPAPPPAASRAPRHSTVRVERLPPCVHTDCQGRPSQSQCFGVLGCSWCHAAQDGAALPTPFCGRQETCYSGLLNSPSPYSLSHSLTHVSPRSGEGESSLLRASPIGPVAGGIMAFFLLLAMTAWGYRTWSGGERGLGDRRSCLQLEEEPAQELPRAGLNNYGLSGGELGAGLPVVSPYRMNPGYRRPRPGPGTDSDHGYSTMTPFGDQDSEIMSCLGEGRRTQPRLPHSLQSVTSGVSSRAPSPQGGLQLPVQQGGLQLASLQGGLQLAVMSTQLPLNKQADSECARLVAREEQGSTVLPHQMVVAALVHMVDT